MENEGVMEEEEFDWIFIFMAKKLQFLPSVRPMRKQTKLHSGFTLGKLMQPSPGITLFCQNGLFYLKNCTYVKKLSGGGTACLFHAPLQALVATITELKVRAGTIFCDCEKSNDGYPRKRR